MTGKLLEWKDDVVKVNSAFFGEVKLDGGMVSGIEFVLIEAEKKTAKTSVEDTKKQALPDIIFLQDNINLDDLDGVPDAWNVKSGFIFPRLKNNLNLPKLNR